MPVKIFKISDTSVKYYFQSAFRELSDIVDKSRAVLITDENVFQAHSQLLRPWEPIIIKSGESHKNLQTVQFIIDQLVRREADKSTTLIGVGGGVVTDITGFAASIYMRGVPFGFVPTTLLNMIDASIGGKNGIDFGVYKNMIGSINQPAFVFQDISLLHTLPEAEWENGFAEIIKHACIKDDDMFAELQKNSISFYQKNPGKLERLIRKNILIKLKIVQKDVYEKGDRKLLNFGHTIGHAIENTYGLPHGRAISIGMALASVISEKRNGFKETKSLISILKRYNLPVSLKINADTIFDILKMDKKRASQEIRFVLLNKIGEGSLQSIPLTQLKRYLIEFEKETQ